MKHQRPAIPLAKQLRPSALYSSKIIKAGALIGDTKTLLSHWDVDASAEANINRVHSMMHTLSGTSAFKVIENHLGKAYIKQMRMVVVPQ